MIDWPDFSEPRFLVAAAFRLPLVVHGHRLAEQYLFERLYPETPYNLQAGFYMS